MTAAQSKNLKQKVEDRTRQLQESLAELKESEQLYRHLYEHANEMQASVDSIDARILKCNETLCRRLGYTKTELVGATIFTICDPAYLEQAKGAFKRFQETGGIEGAELLLQSKKGKKIEVILNASVVKKEDGTGPLYGQFSWIDVTDYKKTSMAITELQDRLELQRKELEQFVYIASHDLQEPLRTVAGIADLLNKRYGESFDQTGKKSMQLLLEATDRMNKLIIDLLQYGRIGKDKEFEFVDCAKIVEHAINDLGTVIENQQAEITVGKLPKKIRAYPTEMKQLFQNLINNAVKFSQADRAPKVQISADQKNQYWQFAIEDNGIGIAEKHKNKIFEIFHRLNHRKAYLGTGIGLAHCKKIVELHKGKIWVESILGEGSTFYFTIPKRIG